MYNHTVYQRCWDDWSAYTMKKLHKDSSMDLVTTQLDKCADVRKPMICKERWGRSSFVIFLLMNVLPIDFS